MKLLSIVLFLSIPSTGIAQDCVNCKENIKFDDSSENPFVSASVEIPNLVRDPNKKMFHYCSIYYDDDEYEVLDPTCKLLNDDGTYTVKLTTKGSATYILCSFVLVKEFDDFSRQMDRFNSMAEEVFNTCPAYKNNLIPLTSTTNISINQEKSEKIKECMKPFASIQSLDSVITKDIMKTLSNFKIEQVFVINSNKDEVLQENSTVKTYEIGQIIDNDPNTASEIFKCLDGEGIIDSILDITIAMAPCIAERTFSDDYYEAPLACLKE